MYAKCSDSEDSERKKRKSPLSTTTLSFDAPFPANPREYLHKPYTARNCVPLATFFAAKIRPICVALQVSKQFCLNPEYAKALDAKPKTFFNAK